jgi:phage repressor protein C with HTH and peptisase S24 domain
LCEGTDISVPALKGWELFKGIGLTEAGASKLVVAFKDRGIYCTEAWLMHGIGTEAAPFSEGLNINDREDEQITKEILLFREQADTLDAVVKDDSMVPLLYPGNYVAGIIKDIKYAVDKDCIVVTSNNETFIRTVRYGETPGRYNLICINEHSQVAKTEIKNISILAAAPIIWVRRKSSED